VRAVVDLLRNTMREGTLDSTAVKRVLRAVPSPGGDDLLPPCDDSNDAFYERGLDFAVELLNGPTFLSGARSSWRARRR